MYLIFQTKKSGICEKFPQLPFLAKRCVNTASAL
jgi:hypothetical protein